MSLGLAAQPGTDPTSGAKAEVAAAVEYDIDSQPLPEALDFYSLTSGTQVLYDGVLARGRTSSPVHGKMTADAALSAMLAGTGLMATFTRDRNVIIVLSLEAPALNHSFPPAGPSTQLGAIHVDVPKRSTSGGLYANLVQFELQRALRRAPNLIVGNYEALVRIWLDANGCVLKSQLIASKGDVRSDRSLLQLVQGLAVGSPPPADLLQPVSVHVAVMAR